MQTHCDEQHRKQFMEFLEARAEVCKAQQASQITLGKPGEEPLARWKASNGVYVTHMPNDEQGILRISCGGGDNLPVRVNYVTIRGSLGECIELLKKAIAALRECPD